MTVRVLLADDQPLIRSGLRVLIDATADLRVVGEAGDGEEAVSLARELRPDVVVMDIRMPGTDGIEATARLTAVVDPPPPRVLMLTTFDDDAYVYGALRAGASGFLVKDMALDDILAAVRVVAGGDALLAPAVTRRLIAEFAARPEPSSEPSAESPTGPGSGPGPWSAPGLSPALLAGVTEREREVLELVARGLTNAEIAAQLHISIATAKAHVARLLTKLDARDRVQLVILAYESGLAGGR